MEAPRAELMVFEVNACVALDRTAGLQHSIGMLNFTHFTESHLRCAGPLPPARGSIAYAPG